MAKQSRYGRLERPEGFKPQDFQGVGSTAVKLGGGILVAGGGALLSLFNARRKVEEGSVAIRTFDDRALDKHGQPLHKILEPGRHWMLPFFQNIEKINIQRQTSVIATNLDLPINPGEKVTQQYNIGATVTWGVRTEQVKPVTTYSVRHRKPRTVFSRPKVNFWDAYKAFYGIDSYEDQELKVASVSTQFLLECARELESDERNESDLAAHANSCLEHISGLDEYGLQVYGFEVTNFALGGVVQLGGPVQVEIVAADAQLEEPPAPLPGILKPYLP